MEENASQVGVGVEMGQSWMFNLVLGEKTKVSFLCPSEVFLRVRLKIPSHFRLQLHLNSGPLLCESGDLKTRHTVYHREYTICDMGHTLHLDQHTKIEVITATILRSCNYLTYPVALR